MGDGAMVLCKVSDATPILEDFASGWEVCFSEGVEYENQLISPTDNLIVDKLFNMFIVLEDNVELDMFGDGSLVVTFPKKGVYFVKGDTYITSLTINGYNGF